MRKLFLLLITLFITTISFTQEKWYVDTNWRNIYTRKMDVDTNRRNILDTNKKWYNNSPGDELRKYSKHFYTGTAFILGGSGLIYLGSRDSDLKPISVVGALISIVGTILVVEAPIHLKRAGILLNENGVGVKIKL